MSVTYRTVPLKEAKVVDGSPVLAYKTWGYFGANGDNYMHGGTRGRRISVSGIAPRSETKTFPDWKDGAVGTLVMNTETLTNVVVLDVTFGNWFTDAVDGISYQFFTIEFLKLR